VTIQFKDKELELILTKKAALRNAALRDPADEKSASQIAAREIHRYYQLVTSEPSILSWQEFYAFCSTVKAMPHLPDINIKRVPALVEDSMKSSRMAETGQYSKQQLWGVDVDELCMKLHRATPLELFALLDRAELFEENDLKEALLDQKK
jgi:hypothetical protein